MTANPSDNYVDSIRTAVARGRLHIKNIKVHQENSAPERRYRGLDLVEVTGATRIQNIYDAEKANKLPPPDVGENGKRLGYTLNQALNAKKYFGNEVKRKPGELGQCLAISNQKGGSQKTTSTIQVGTRVAELGLDVLLIDFDPQRSLSLFLGIGKAASITLENTLAPYILEEKNPEKVAFDENVIQKTKWSTLDIIPCCPEFMQIEQELYFREREILNDSSLDKKSKDFKILQLYHSVKRLVDEFKKHYDLIIIDGLPNVGFMQVSIFNAADALLVPIPCEFLDYVSTVSYIEQILSFAEQYKQRVGLELDFPELKLVPVKFSSISLAVTEDILTIIRDTFGSMCTETKIKVHNVVRDHHLLGESLFQAETLNHSNATGLKKAKANYAELTDEILKTLVIKYIPSFKENIDKLLRA